ncbi:MAG: DUF86 domain-containing protein [Candidatus Staskawiczbacteria bacterium]|nr:DUF86 domain-containing protein [Candidatus Staskawiczbacteria bacterium]
MKNENRNFAMFLQDIIECAEKIDKYTKNITENDFTKNEQIKDAVIMRIGIVGEAVKNLPAGLKKGHKEVNWKKSVKMRNIFMHVYFGIDCHRLWKTAKVEIPVLKEKVAKILEELNVNKLI